MSTLNKLKILFALIGLAYTGISPMNGQSLNNQFWVQSHSIQVDQDTVLLVAMKKFNAFSFQTESMDFGGLKVQTSQRTVALTKDEHVTRSMGIQSNLIVCDEEQMSVFLISNGFRGNLTWVTQYVAPLSNNTPPATSRRATCDHPSMVLQSTWRQGLPDPTPGRNATPTEHCIVHHSADGNGNKDYTSLVRAYYTHHTQTNGWDDIGYNYLIADDGTLYAGRDPEISSIGQDDVQGAHFCGKNQKTMGVCIIGEYSSVEPSFAAINTLTNLLTWKLDKEGFTVNDSFPHPTNLDPLLSVIDGHRSACSTTCPGDNLWNHMVAIRQEVHNKLDQCSSVGLANVQSSAINIYPNPSKGEFLVRFPKPMQGTLSIKDMTGKTLAVHQFESTTELGIAQNNIPTGSYFIEISTGETIYIHKLLIN